MSFTAHRVYTLVAGVDYNPSTNGNVAVKFRGSYDSTNPNNITVVSFIGGINPIDRINAIIAASGNPVIIGPGFVGRDIITGPPVGQDIPTTTDPGATPGFPNGTYDYYIFDDSLPSSIDSPILAIHILANPGATDFSTLTGDSVSWATGGEVSPTGIYEYSVGLVTALGNAGTLLGLAPASRSNQW
jgi:hypothetical protein